MNYFFCCSLSYCMKVNVFYNFIKILVYKETSLGIFIDFKNVICKKYCPYLFQNKDTAKKSNRLKYRLNTCTISRGRRKMMIKIR